MLNLTNLRFINFFFNILIFWIMKIFGSRASVFGHVPWPECRKRKDNFYARDNYYCVVYKSNYKYIGREKITYIYLYVCMYILPYINIKKTELNGGGGGVCYGYELMIAIKYDSTTKISLLVFYFFKILSLMVYDMVFLSSFP